MCASRDEPHAHPKLTASLKAPILAGRHGEELVHSIANAAGAQRAKIICNTQIYEVV